MKESLKKELEAVVNATINEDTATLKSAFHRYLQAKTKAILAESDDSSDDKSEDDSSDDKSEDDSSDDKKPAFLKKGKKAKKDTSDDDSDDNTPDFFKKKKVKK